MSTDIDSLIREADTLKHVGPFVGRLIKALRECRADRDRIDRLEQATLVLAPDAWPHNNWRVDDAVKPTLREAIDAARGIEVKP